METETPTSYTNRARRCLSQDLFFSSASNAISDDLKSTTPQKLVASLLPMFCIRSERRKSCATFLLRSNCRTKPQPSFMNDSEALAFPLLCFVSSHSHITDHWKHLRCLIKFSHRFFPQLAILISTLKSFSSRAQRTHTRLNTLLKILSPRLKLVTQRVCHANTKFTMKKAMR